MRVKVRGERVYATRDDVRSRRISKVRPYRDQARLSEPGYVHSLPKPADGKSYFHRDDEGGERMLRTFFGRGEDDPEAEEIEPPLPEGDYYGMNSYDGVHIYRQQRDVEGEELPPVENNGLRIGNDLPARLAEQNKVNDAFWKRQYAGDAPHSAPPNARAIASTIAAARSDTGTHDAAMLMQKANRAVNLSNRAHYAGGQDNRTHDAPRPKGFVTPAQINAANRAKWNAGRQ